MKPVEHLRLRASASLLHALNAAAEDRALRGRNLSAACGGYTAGHAAARQPDWPVPAGILPKRKIHYASAPNRPNKKQKQQIKNTSIPLSTTSGKVQTLWFFEVGPVRKGSESVRRPVSARGGFQVPRFKVAEREQVFNGCAGRVRRQETKGG